MKHTPTPYRIGTAVEGLGIRIQGAGNVGTIAFVRDTQHPLTNIDEHTASTNAEFIVRACNLHEEMLELLSTLLIIQTDTDARDAIRALLKKARTK